VALALIQLIVTVVAGFGLFLLWRRVSRGEGPLFWIVTAGVLIRAFGGQVAFWVSYLRLPIATSLQLGDGFWFFAPDSVEYFKRALTLAHNGPGEILFMSMAGASPVFAQLLAAAVYLFGPIPSVAILINLACYLGFCAMVLEFGRPAGERPVLYAIGALSFAPSAILWSLQPLKDTFFLFLLAMLFAGAFVWSRLWSRTEAPRTAAVVGWTLVLVAAQYAISGIRPYFGPVIFAAAMPFVLLTILLSRWRKQAIVMSGVLLVLLVVAFYGGGGPNIPRPFRTGLWRFFSHGAAPSSVISVLNDNRSGFDRSGGATIINAGKITGKLEHGVARPYGTKGEFIPASVPASTSARLVIGLAAVLVPRFIGEALGLFDVGGGRGFWLLADLDTLFLDAVLLFAVVSLVRAARRRQWREPVFWLILLVTGAIGFAVSYSVSNFGTLFRLRDMILPGLAILPISLRSSGPATADEGLH
jgi:hypothetical protein